MQPSRIDYRLVVSSISAAAKRFKGARKAWERIARDLLAILTGVRAIAMLDYAVVDLQALGAILDAVRGILPEQASHLHVLELGGCLYPCNLKTLTAHCRDSLPKQDGASPVLFVKLSSQGGASVDPSEAASIAEGLRPIVEVLEGLLSHVGSRDGELPTGARPCGGSLALDLEQALGRSLMATGLPGADALPLLPTVNGWLLGYPCVYLVTTANADTAASVLSSTSLTLYELSATCELVAPPTHRNPMDASAPDVLYSFTVPSALAGETDGDVCQSGCLRPSRFHIEAAIASVPEVWGALKVRVRGGILGPVAL